MHIMSFFFSFYSHSIFLLSSLQLSGQELFVSGSQTRQLRPREVKQLAQGPPLGNRRNQWSIPGCLPTEPEDRVCNWHSLEGAQTEQQ